jgi:hypothetical protein
MISFEMDLRRGEEIWMDWFRLSVAGEELRDAMMLRLLIPWSLVRAIGFVSGGFCSNS